MPVRRTERWDMPKNMLKSAWYTKLTNCIKFCWWWWFVSYKEAVLEAYFYPFTWNDARRSISASLKWIKLDSCHVILWIWADIFHKINQNMTLVIDKYVYISLSLTLFLPESLEVISLCHQYRTRLACTSVQSDQALYCWLANFKFSSWYP